MGKISELRFKDFEDWLQFIDFLLLLLHFELALGNLLLQLINLDSQRLKLHFLRLLPVFFAD